MAEEVGKFLARISMEVGDPNVGPRIENVLGAVAVVVVDVENRDFRMACMTEHLCGNRRIVEVAVPAELITHCVMARRPAPSERYAPSAGDPGSSGECGRGAALDRRPGPCCDGAVGGEGVVAEERLERLGAHITEAARRPPTPSQQGASCPSATQRSHAVPRKSR